jgi:hypothetical protein
VQIDFEFFLEKKVSINSRAYPALIGVQDEDSCGKSELGETPQEQSDEEAYQPPAESEVLHEIKSGISRTIYVF